MGERGWGRWAVAVVIGLLAPFVVPEAMHGAEAAPACGAKDLPETGVGGNVPLADQLTGRADQGYNCGLALVGYSSLGGRGGNGNMAWSGDCAYIAGNGIAVVDVHDPAHPRQVQTIHGPGSDETFETIHAVDAPDRSILVAGRYGVFGFVGSGLPAPVDIWDVRDCTHPKLLSTMTFPDNVHNLTLTADGRRLWSTLPLVAADLTDPRHPTYLGSIEGDIVASGVQDLYYAHEAWPSADGTRLYVGGQIIGNEELLVIDTTGWPARRAKVLGRTASPGHSIRPATIGGKQYLVNSDESVVSPTARGCLPTSLTPVGGASQPFLTDISTERAPHVVGQFRLPINEPLNCADQLASYVNASVHYQDVDDPNDTTFVMASMWNAGLRLIDVRDPAHPREAAYFNPGRFTGTTDSFGGSPGFGEALGVMGITGLDQAWAHSRYRADTGQIWLTTRNGGFWVLELEPQLRAALGLPARRSVHPAGAIPRPAATRIAVNPFAGASSAYCTLNTATAVVASAVATPFRG